MNQTNICIPNNFFQDLKNLESKDVRLYLAIKMLEYIEEHTTQEALSKILGISDRALRPSLQNLIKRGHCFQKKGNFRQSVPSTYHTSHLITSAVGYIPFTYNDIFVYVNELCEKTDRTRANGELVLYLFFRWKFYSDENYISQSNLGKNIGFTQQAISQVVNRLQKKHYIKVDISNNGIYEYTLLR